MRRAAACFVACLLAAWGSAGQNRKAAPKAKAAAGPPAAALSAFQGHVRATESGLDSLLADNNAFLWAKTAAERTKLRQGEVVCAPGVGKGEQEAPRGLIHHWIGAVFIPGVSVPRVLDLIQDYTNHKNAYPNVVDSRTVSRRGDDFTVFLRLRERKPLVTVVLDTDYEVEYRPLGNGDWRSRSRSTRIQEVENPGPKERLKPPGADRGFLWALNTYWLFRGRDGGVYVECEAVSLSKGLGLFDPVLRGIVRGLPREFLRNTLQATRDLVLNSSGARR